MLKIIVFHGKHTTYSELINKYANTFILLVDTVFTLSHVDKLHITQFCLTIFRIYFKIFIIVFYILRQFLLYFSIA